MTRIAISSWSIDGLLNSGTPLLEVPAILASYGIDSLELCHFHLPDTSAGYIAMFRQALADANVELYSLLIDTGDIASPDQQKRTADLATISSWIVNAALLGAGRVRIDAGQQVATPEVIERSAKHMQEFVGLANTHGLKVITENWRETSRLPEALLAIIERCNGEVTLCADTGNAEATPDKYATLEKLLPFATSMHLKVRRTADGAIEMHDLQRCIGMARSAGFDGNISLIYDGKKREWEEIANLRAALLPLIA